MDKYLLVKLNHIGDTLLMTPTIRAIKEKDPNSIIDVVVRKGCESVLIDNPDISNIFLVSRPEKRERSIRDFKINVITFFKIIFSNRYRYAFDLSNSDRAKIIVLASRAHVRGINDWHADLGLKRYFFNAFSNYAWGPEHQVLRDFRTVMDVLEWDCNPGPLVMSKTQFYAPKQQGVLVGFSTDKKYVVVHPTSRWAYKEWEISRWAAVASLLMAGGYQVIISVGPAEKERSDSERVSAMIDGTVYQTYGQLTLQENAALLRGAELFLGVDTAMMHIAAACQTPSIVLFGPSSEWSWAPWKCENRLILGDCNCKVRRDFICDKTRIYPCMDSITVERVQSAIVEIIKEKVGVVNEVE